MKKIVGFIIILITANGFAGWKKLLAQQNITDPNGYNIFYYPNGQISSEGMMKEGRPDGYWKTYYVTGIIKSEGNRNNFMLDSIWVFYDATGDTIQKINYMYGKKNGYMYTYDPEKSGVSGTGNALIAKELYVNDKKEGRSYYYFPDRRIKEVVNYSNGKREGMTQEYEEDGNLVAIMEYHEDILIDRQRINRRDEKGLKQGRWVEFFDDWRIKMEAFYNDGVLDGSYKEYDNRGRLLINQQYRDGRIQENDLSTESDVEIRNTYFDNGKVKYSGAFRGNSPIGIHREYNQEGQVISADIYDELGRKISTGVVNDRGERMGRWSDFYYSGKKKAEGIYVNNRRSGEWIFYAEDGRLEQNGEYSNGLEDGLWKWYFENGSVWREEEYFNGKEDGISTEYDRNGEIIATGGYIEGEKEGEWFYKVGDHTEKGKYIVGLREGEWKYYYENDIISFIGRYTQGNPDGKHVYYYDNGIIKEERYYVRGVRERNWKKYDPEGNLFITITYKDNNEYRINGIRIRLPEPEVTLIR